MKTMFICKSLDIILLCYAILLNNHTGKWKREHAKYVWKSHYGSQCLTGLEEFEKNN